MSVGLTRRPWRAKNFLVRIRTKGFHDSNFANLDSLNILFAIHYGNLNLVHYGNRNLRLDGRGVSQEIRRPRRFPDVPRSSS